MLGDFGVGKTSLVRRHVYGSFSPVYQATLGVNIYRNPASEGSDGPDLVIWDIEGDALGQRSPAAYLLGAAGAIVVADRSRPGTAEALTRHGERFLRENPGRAVVFAVNKCDLPAGDAALGASGLPGPLFETSAATGDAVASLFQALREEILARGL